MTASHPINISNNTVRNRYDFLDMLRGVAALAVALLHGCQIFKISYAPVHATLAVDFFFCLSGFVVAFSYHERLNNGLKTNDFFIKRLIRLYPLILLGVLIGAAVTVGKVFSSKTMTYSEFIVILSGSIFLIPAALAYGLPAYPLNNPMWSLFFELAANYIYAFQAKWKIISVAIFTVVCGSFLVTAILLFDGLENIGFKSNTFLFGFARVGYGFLSGVIIYILNLHLISCIRVNRYIVIFILVSILMNPFAVGNAAYDIIMVIFAVPLIVFFAIHAQNSKEEPSFLILLGILSYPFYVIHQPILRSFKILFDRGYLLSTPVALVVILSLFTSATLAYIAFKFYDIPVRTRLSRWAQRHIQMNVALDNADASKPMVKK